MGGRSALHSSSPPAHLPPRRSASVSPASSPPEIDVSELTDAANEYVEQVSQAVATDTDTASYVEELERRADSLDWLEESGDLPSGDALAAEITRFLRERESDDDQPGSGGAG